MNNLQEDLNRNADFETLSHVARLSNALAKQLTDLPRTLAYRIKAEACSSLIVTGNAQVNGVRPDGIIALDLDGRDDRIHIRRSHLTPAARRIVDRQAPGAPIVDRLENILNAKRSQN